MSAPTGEEARPQGALTVKEFAQRMNVSVDTVRFWLKSGTLKGVKMGDQWQHQWRIPRSELDRLGV